MIKISKEHWKSIDLEWKGVWDGYYGIRGEMIGRRFVMSGCVTGSYPTGLGYLMFEGQDFIIED